MKVLRDHSILFAILLFVFLIARKHFFWISCVLVCVLFYLRSKSISWIILFLTCLFVSIPRGSTQLPAIEEGRVIQANAGYAILQNGNTKIITYTDELLKLDGTYQWKGSFYEIEKTNGFFRYDFQNWCHSEGIYYCLDPDEMTLKSKGHSFRSAMQERIEAISNTEERDILLKVLLNIKSKDAEEDSWMVENGFSYSGILAVMEYLMKFRIHKVKRDPLMCGITFVFALLFRFPLLLVESLLFRLASYTKLTYRCRTGLVMSLIMILYPSKILSASFIIPAIYRFSFLFEEGKKTTFYLILIVQSILFQTINPLKCIVYKWIQRYLGILWLFALIRIVLNVMDITILTTILQTVFSFLNMFEIKGSILGCGVIFYVLACIAFRKMKYASSYRIILLCIFQYFGLFHPFAELTLINVSQGDSILLRGPLNSTNILIDTGKPSAWDALETYLDAKGIRHLDGLIITHEDDDHSGNKDAVIDKYHPEVVIEEHTDKYEIGIFTLYDVNTIENEDENQSSITNVMHLNGMNVCLMADIDSEGEDDLIQKYPDMHCDVLKIAHHGSSTSTNNNFLDTVKPDLALISSGPYYIYHHPSSETLQKLLKRHIPYFDTKTSGDISIICFPFGNLFITSTFEIGFL